MTNKQIRTTAGRLALSLFLIASTAYAAPALAQKKPKAAAEMNVMRPLRSPVTNSLSAVGGTWTAQGPAPIHGGQVEAITDRPVIGAINAIVTHPSNADVMWVGSVNGGIWKTTNATNSSPSWTPLTDVVGSLSISALQRDPTDGTNNTLVGVTGDVSSIGWSGPLGRILRTTNGGTSWTASTPSTLVGAKLTGVAAHGATIVVSAINYSGCAPIFRSTDSGATFSAVTSGLPASAVAWHVARDPRNPSNPAILYAAITECFGGGGSGNGIYRSTNTGASWTKVSSSAMNTLMATAVDAEIAVGATGEVYVAVMSPGGNDGELGGLFRSSNGTSGWTQLDNPTTTDNGVVNGLHPGFHARLHFSMVADPSNSNLVYVGGDVQPLGTGGTNSIGATDFTGRLFRVDASASPGSQSTPLTHCSSATSACNNAQSTSSNSAPHADSRAMAFDKNGNLIEADDGGVYRRTSPSGTGDWFSVNGNLQITEMNNIAWDRISNMIIGGNQDNGTAEQTTVGGTTWRKILGGDGGDVAVDDTTSLTQSVRFSSIQRLDFFTRRYMDDTGSETAKTSPAMIVIDGSANLIPEFISPVELNRIDQRRMLFSGSNDLYESLDRGDTIGGLGLNKFVKAMVYGGRISGSDNLDLIWAITNSPTKVYLRTSGGGTPTQTSATPTTEFLRDIAADLTDSTKAWVITQGGLVWATSNSGASWSNVTGNLGSGTTDIHTIAYIPGNPGYIVVGGLNGVFRMATNAAGTWNQLGTGLSNAIVYDLDYDAYDDTLVAGTLGRGAWKLTGVAVSGTPPTLSVNDVTVTEGNSGTTNATFTVSLSASSNHVVGVEYATANSSATAQSATFATTSWVSIFDNQNADPYPSTISVSGMTETIKKVTVTLSNFWHTYPSDVSMLLVGPNGQSVVLMSDAGGSNPASAITLTFDDAAPTQLPASDFFSSTSYRPTNYFGGDVFGSPAPSPPYGSTLSVFNGTSANGTWSLYVIDSASSDQGVINDGWSITFSGGDYSPASGLLTFYPGTTTRNVPVTVHGDTTAELTETFLVNLSNASNATISDSQGQGTITNDDAPAAPTNVVAAATTSTNVNISWTAALAGSTYRVYRKAPGGSYAQVGSDTTNTFLNDGTVSANTAYLYKVRSVAAIESADSSVDLATTVIFTDPTLTSGMPIMKLAYFTELLTAVNAVRTLAGLSSIAFTSPTPTVGANVRAAYLTDLRTGLDAARSALSLSAQGYTDPTLVPAVTIIKAVQLNEVRTGVR